MKKTVRVTLDTNMIDDKGMMALQSAAESKGVVLDVAVITVTLRERGESPYLDGFGGSAIPETAVWGESCWGKAVWGGVTVPEALVIGETPIGQGAIVSDSTVDAFEAILTVIAGGSFPRHGERDDLTTGQHRQLRDAMIFEAHVRSRRDVFVTNDRKGFINGGRKEALERIGATCIVTADELGVLWP